MIYYALYSGHSVPVCNIGNCSFPTSRHLPHSFPGPLMRPQPTHPLTHSYHRYTPKYPQKIFHFVRNEWNVFSF